MSASLNRRAPAPAPRSRPYDSDLTDDEWRLVQPLIEVAQRGPGPRRSVDLREVLNAVLYKQRTGCQWRMLPPDLPPRSTVSGYFQRWSKTGVLDQVYAALWQSGRDAALAARPALLARHVPAHAESAEFETAAHR